MQSRRLFIQLKWSRLNKVMVIYRYLTFLQSPFASYRDFYWCVLRLKRRECSGFFSSARVRYRERLLRRSRSLCNGMTRNVSLKGIGTLSSCGLCEGTCRLQFDFILPTLLRKESLRNKVYSRFSHSCCQSKLKERK